jgi:hypothetical protein
MVEVSGSVMLPMAQAVVAELTKTFAGSLLLFPKLFAGFSFGLETLAVLRKVPVADDVLANTIISEKFVPPAIT